MNSSYESPSLFNAPVSSPPIGSGVGAVTSGVGAVTNTATGWLGGISYTTWFIILLILAILGVNVFAVVGRTSETLVDTFGGPIKRLVAFMGWGVGETAKQVITVSADGAEGGIGLVEETAVSGIDAIENALTGTSHPTGDRTVATALGVEVTPRYEASNEVVDEEENPDEPRAGFCYIGSDRGFRSCASVGETDKCISGDIFPSQEICVNPNLR